MLASKSAPSNFAGFGAGALRNLSQSHSNVTASMNLSLLNVSAILFTSSHSWSIQAYQLRFLTCNVLEGRMKRLQASNEPEDETKSTNAAETQPTETTAEPESAPTLDLSKVAILWVCFVSFWPTLAYIRLNYDFDVDTFLVMKDLLQEPDYDTIQELPQLSPAERLLDSLFGPPGVDRRGF